jgi:hypothetical protein
LEDGIANTHLTKPTAEGIWKKAAMFVGEEKAIVSAPGFGPNDKMVKSKSGTTPHLVTVAKSNKMVQYKCDDKCPQYKSVYICSHTIAAAELNRDVVDFLKWYQQNRGKSQIFQNLVVMVCQLDQVAKVVRSLRRKQHVSATPWMKTEFLLTPHLNPLPVALVEFCHQLIYMSMLQVCMYLHITPILQLLSAVTGRGIVVLQLEQHILATVIGILTLTRVRQQVQRIHLTPLIHGLQHRIHPGLHLALFHLNFLPHHLHLRFQEVMVLILLVVAHTKIASR